MGIIQIFRSRKIVFIAIGLLIFLLYMWPSWLTLSPSTSQPEGPLESCVFSQLHKYDAQSRRMNTFIQHIPKRPDVDSKFVSYVGNGHMGTSIKSTLYVRNKTDISIPINYFHHIGIDVPGSYRQGAVVTNIKEGTVQEYNCFQMPLACVTSVVTLYIHRTRPEYLVQDIHIFNPTNVAVQVSLSRHGASKWSNSKHEEKSFSVGGNRIYYDVTSGLIRVPGTRELIFAISVASERLPTTISVAPGSSWKFHLLTSVVAGVPTSQQLAQLQRANITARAEESFRQGAQISANLLYRLHVETWQKLWYSGFGISRSLASSAINGDRINATLYYLMCHSQAPIHEWGRTSEEKSKMENSLFFPDRCYDDHPTLQHATLWRDVTSVSGIIFAVQTWLLTLRMHSCDTMLQAGADGVLQAAMLSFGGLKFQNYHLEMNVHPKDLHRDYFWRRINYGNNTHVNISVIVNEDNQAQLFASLDRKDKPYYACAAGCLEEIPVKLSKKWNVFPVKLTDPLKAILYITSDKDHMTELKNSIHTREIALAPAHEHHVMALHRHGSHYGGLPMLFWISIIFLVAIFHLFLIKLIINEYCQGGPSVYVRAKYNL